MTLETGGGSTTIIVRETCIDEQGCNNGGTIDGGIDFE